MASTKSWVKTYSRGRVRLVTWTARRSEKIRTAILVLFVLLFAVYLCFCVQRSVRDNVFLLVCSAIAVLGCVFHLVRSTYGATFVTWYELKVKTRIIRYRKYVRWSLYGCTAVAVIIFLSVDVARRSPYNLVSISGLVFFVALSIAYSKSPAKIPWRTVFCGVVLQLVIGLIVIRWSFGRQAIQWLAHYLSVFLQFGQKGCRMVFGEAYEEHGFAMAALPLLTWFNAVTNALLYLGVLQHVAKLTGKAIHFFMPGTSLAEAFVAATDIFLGPESSVLMIRPMVCRLADSELFSLMTCGLSSIEAGMFPMFESFGIPIHHLLSASCMSAPAALMTSKIIFPDNKQGSKTNKRLEIEKPRAINVVDAFLQGAIDSVPMIARVAALLMAAISLLEFVNTNLTWFGNRAGIDELTLQMIMAYILTPVAFLMGISWEDCPYVASLMGTKTIINEFVAYTQLAELIKNRELGLEPSISPRSEAIAAYALCGFSNFGTMAAMIAFMSSLLPDKIGVISEMAFRSLVGSSIACFMTGCVAGILSEQ